MNNGKMETGKHFMLYLEAKLITQNIKACVRQKNNAKKKLELEWNV